MRTMRACGPVGSRSIGLVSTLALAFVMSLPAGAMAQTSGEGSVSLAVGTQGPGAALEDLDGGAVDLLDFAPVGKPALLEFWATWCEQCEALQPQLDGIQMDYGDDINIVAVAVGVSQSVRRVKRHLEEHDPGYPYLFDARGGAVRAYNAFTTSIVVILDQEGKVAYTGVGPQQDLVTAVEAVLGNPTGPTRNDPRRARGLSRAGGFVADRLFALGFGCDPINDLAQLFVSNRIVRVERLDRSRDPAVRPDHDYGSAVDHVVVPQTATERRVGLPIGAGIARENEGEVLVVQP